MKPWLPVLMICAVLPAAVSAQDSGLRPRIAELTEETKADVVTWRRDLHAHPELSNREFRTAEIVAKHLQGLGLQVTTGVAHTGVVGVLRGGRPGPVVALRADMDALPVTEEVELPFASKVRTEYLGREVGVMHACGHDNHVAILMGAATVLSRLREDLPGTVVFLFQPAEEGAPDGEDGGAELMIREGALADPKPEAAFALHVFPGPAGDITYRAGGALAAADELRMVVRGRQSHAAWPWSGVDPIVTASQIVVGLQTVVARQLDLTQAPAVVSIGMIHGGVRHNIIPNEVELRGTIRTLSPDMRESAHALVRRTAENIARASGAEADVQIIRGYPVTMNDPALTRSMLPTLQWAAGEDRVSVGPPKMGAEDFSLFAQQCPGLYINLGVTPRDQDWTKAASNHSPLFFADESALPVGVRVLSGLAADYLVQHAEK